MEVEVISRSGKDLGKFSITDKLTVKDFKKMFNQKHKQWSPERQKFTIKTPTGAALYEEEKTLVEYLKGDKVLVFRDLGTQLSWRFVYMVEYAGPLFICPALYCLPHLFYGEEAAKTITQKICFWLIMGHFLKRELESLFVHRFSNATMPLKNLFVNCTYYWILNGAFIGYFLFHPKYTDPNFSAATLGALLVVFLGSEFMNFLCHMVLRNLRPAGTKTRGIPKGCGFDLVSCANYFWEVISWASFAVLSACLPAYVFLLATIYILSNWASLRHRKYKKEFDGKEGKLLYPRSRKALFPFIF
ncbi:unnamed protein product [Blepharisma stoltei]|uniref:3-oxo-5-alpha-steroid 4-dehydrogenase C-terminal domain-containing protein n=1 Tax=Blepharisma stoltei TaxID=1481888 RepID=A0AAU9KEA6_9CILI|nr:unnamed protein product [Blepharisma stoltei]